MPHTFGQQVADTARTLASNATTSVLNATLKKSFPHQPIIVDDEEEAELVTNVLAVAIGAAKMGSAALMIAGGAVLALVPHKVLQVDTVEGHVVDEIAPDISSGEDVVTIAEVKLVPGGGRGPLHPTRTTKTKNWDEVQTKDWDKDENDGSISNNIDDQMVVGRPRLPLLDDPELVMNFSSRKKPLEVTKASTTVSGFGLMSAGVGTAASGAYDVVAGLSTVVCYGGMKLYNRFFNNSKGQAHDVNTENKTTTQSKST